MFKLRSLLLVLLLPLAAVSQAHAQAKAFFFKDGDKIVVMGDSITEQHLYSNYLEMWTVSRFPKWKLTFRNVGIGGDRSTGGNSRFKRDVLAHEATALTVDFGMNDGNYAPFNEKSFGAYMKGLQGIADQAKAANIRVAWITPQPCEHGPETKGYNDTLEKFSEGVQEIAKKNDGLFVDQFHPYYAVIKKARSIKEKVTAMGGDAVHPGPAGQSVMAASILKGMSFPTLVSRVVIDAKANKVVDSANCDVKLNEKRPANAVAFSQLDHALPFFPMEAKGILEWTPLLTDMNVYELKVAGLPEGNYSVSLGGKAIAEYSAKELEAGVNLTQPALKAGPVAEQVQKVWTAVKTKNQYFHDQIFRGVLLAGGNSAIFKGVDKADFEKARKTAYTERMAKMPELDNAVRQALTMTAHEVLVAPAEKK